MKLEKQAITLKIKIIIVELSRNEKKKNLHYDYNSFFKESVTSFYF